MKKALLVLVALMIATAAFAVDASKMTEQGTKALLFNATVFNAGLFNGGLGMKYYLSPGMALRPVLKFGYTSETTKTEADSTAQVGGIERHNNYKDATDKTMTFGLELAVEKTMWSMSAVNVNVGAVAGFGMTSETIEAGVNYTYTQGGTVLNHTGSASSKTEISHTNFGGGLLLGAEWFLNENISLGAEYQFGLGMTSEGKDQTTATGSVTTGGATTTATSTTKNPLTKTMDFGFQTIGVVLGIRF
jgi:opacity protein-like surface antigen